MTNQSLPYIPNMVTRTLVCVDVVGESDFSGTLYNPYMPKPVAFGQLKDIITVLEDFFNQISYPQPLFEDRSFLSEKGMQEAPPVKVERYADNDLYERHTGDVATFEIHVKYRKNATWQGDFTWKEKDTVSPFRSTLELIRQMDAALGEVSA